ncbi:MAG: radical SAM protein, partial [Eubacteriales bacterium]|nr:radical SAM protein [Eubacteriales bacterium]
MQGSVHSFQSLGTVDGPGVRAVVFLQGCPLRCSYCHNPDTWDAQGGTPMSVDDVLARVLKYRGYFGRHGGVTVSGGEPLLQAAFVRELFAELKRQGVHTALDTSGCLLNDDVDALLDVTDLALLDVKMNTNDDYLRHIGLPITPVLDFLK